MNFEYPKWNQGISYGLYHMNRAAIASDWQSFDMIFEYYLYQSADTSRQVREAALYIARMFNMVRIAEGMQDLSDLNTPPAIYYMYLFNDRPSLASVERMINTHAAERLIGFIHPQMRRDLISSINWYDIELDRPKVAAVINGDITALPYMNLLQSVTGILTDQTYGQLLASTVPTRSIDASQILSLISRARVVTSHMVYSCIALCSKFNLLLPSDANPVMIEMMGGYIDVVDDNPARQLALSLANSQSNPDDQEEDFVLL